MVKKVDKPKDQHLRFIDKERSLLRTRTEKDTNDARMLMSSHPVRPHLLALVDELVRQGIYLPQLEQEAAKLFIKIIGKEIAAGDKLRAATKKRKPPTEANR